MKNHSEQFFRQRKLMTALPLLMLPFITMLFWALDGGKGSYASTEPPRVGLNTEVPGARLDNTPKWDKFSLYEQAQRDSVRKAEAERTDPYFRLKTITELRRKDSLGYINHSLGKRETDLNKTEEEVHQKISAIKSILDDRETSVSPASTRHSGEPLMYEDESIDRLEEMMVLMQESGSTDPELQQIEGVLERILDIQHPERVQDKLFKQSMASPTKVFRVAKSNSSLSAGFFGANDSVQRVSQFYGDHQGDTSHVNLINTVILSTQSITENSIIKLQLLDEIFLSGLRIPRGSFLYGRCAIGAERVSIKVNSVFYQNSLYPVNLIAFDMDGLEGLYVPGTATNDAVKQGSSQAIQDLQIMSLDPSIGAQAANAGIQTARSLMSKRTRTVRVVVRSGYRVLLKDLSKESQF